MTFIFSRLTLRQGDSLTKTWQCLSHSMCTWLYLVSFVGQNGRPLRGPQMEMSIFSINCINPPIIEGPNFDHPFPHVGYSPRPIEPDATLGGAASTDRCKEAPKKLGRRSADPAKTWRFHQAIHGDWTIKSRELIHFNNFNTMNIGFGCVWPPNDDVSWCFGSGWFWGVLFQRTHMMIWGTYIS